MVVAASWTWHVCCSDIVPDAATSYSAAAIPFNAGFRTVIVAKVMRCKLQCFSVLFGTRNSMLEATHLHTSI
jgi:hypothetical protein